MKDYKLYLFDLDGTLAANNAVDFLPAASEWLMRHGKQKLWGICSNQGGVGMKYWMIRDGFGDPSPYPTQAQFEERCAKLLFDYPQPDILLVCYRYKSSKGNWSPVPSDREEKESWSKDWRKPAPGMLNYAMNKIGIGKADTLFVGDSEDDLMAAEMAEIDFCPAHRFFEEYDREADPF